MTEPVNEIETIRWPWAEEGGCLMCGFSHRYQWPSGSDYDHHDGSYMACINMLVPALERLSASREQPITSLCEQTWRASVDGACPVHGGDSCLVNPAALSASREPCTRVHVDPDTQHLLDLIDRLSASRERYREALEQVNTAGHPEWCAWSCFGGVELERCDCWVKPVRQALTEGLEP